MREILPQLKLIIKERKKNIVLKVLRITQERFGGFGRWNSNYKKNILLKYLKQFKALNK
jgi:hypothetical protein